MKLCCQNTKETILKKSIVKHHFLLYFIMIFIFVGILNASTEQNKASLEKVSLQLQWVDQFQFAGYYMAKEKGFYKDAGFDVEIKKFNSDINAVEEVISKRATYGTGRSSLIIEKSNGKDVVLLASIFQSSPLILLSLEESNIKTVEDFKNKRVMITNDAISGAPLKAMSTKKGVEEYDLIIQKHSYDINDLITKKTDLMASYISNEPFTLRQKGIKYKIFDPRDYGFDFYSDILFTSKDELNKNPQRVKKFKQASIKGWEYAFENIDETIDLILKKYNSQNKTKEALDFEANELKKLAYYETNELGKIEEGKIQRIIDIYNLMGFIDKRLDPKEIIANFNGYKLAFTEKEKAFLKDHSVIKVHNEMNWPPYNFNENGKPKGYAIDYMDLLAKKTGIKVNYISGPTWDEFMQMIKDKEIDVILNIRNTEYRRGFINFTNHYLKASKSIFTNLDNIQSLDDLKGKTVAVPKGFFAHEFLEKYYPDIKLILKKDIKESIFAVVYNEADAIMADYGVGKYIMQEHGISIENIMQIKDNRLTSLINIGTRKDWPILRNILQKAMMSVTDEETMRLRQKWFGIQPKIACELSLTKKEKKFIKQNKIKCITTVWEPFNIVNKDGILEGMAFDYWDIIKQKAGLKSDCRATDNWSNVLSFIKNKEADITLSTTITDDRKKYADFSKPYTSFPMVIATRNDHEFIGDISELESKKVAVGRNYSAHKLLKKHYPKIKYVPVNHIPDALKLLSDGNVEAVIDILPVIVHNINKHGHLNLKISGTTGLNFDVRIMARKGTEELIPIINKAIDSIDKNEKERIKNKWISVKYDSTFDYSLIWKLVISIIIVILVFVYWNIRLSSYNRRIQTSNDELKATLKELKNTQNKLVEAEKMAALGNLVSGVSHEINTPIGVAYTTVTALLSTQKQIDEKLKDSKDEELKKYQNKLARGFNMILMNLQRSSELIQGFKRISVDQHKDNLEEISISEYIYNLVNSLKFEYKKYGHTFELPDTLKDKKIFTYPGSLAQVLTNLIMNSIKHGFKDKKNGNIIIKLDYNANNVVIHYYDNGMGIAKSLHNKVFEPFYTTDRKDGTGLGLHVVYNLVTQKLKGIIALESDKDKGVYFKITIPNLSPINLKRKSDYNKMA